MKYLLPGTFWERFGSSARIDKFALLAVILLFFLLFSPSLSHSFVNFDDDVYLYNNPLVTQFEWSRFPEIFSTGHTALFSPLVILSFALEHQLWGLSPLGYRLVNLLLHAGSILLLYSLCMQLFGGRARAFFVSLLFAVHPLRIESVVWVTERKDVLFVFFVLVTMRFYLKYLRQKDNRFYLLALASLSLAMLAKVSAFAALPLIILMDWWEGRKWDRRMLLDKLPLLAVVIMLGLTGMGFLTTVKYGINQDLPRMVLNALGIPAFLVTRFFWPFNLAIRYPLLIEDLLQPFWLHVLLALLFFLFTGWICRWSRRWVFSFGFILVAAVPVLGVMWRMYPMADRYSYLPAVGLGLMVWEALTALAERWRAYRLGGFFKWGVTAYLLIVMVWGTMIYLPIWRDSMSLWNYVIAMYPKSELAFNNRALIFKGQGQYQQALSDLDRAISLYPDYVEAFWNRGLCHDQLKQYNDADREFFQAIYREPHRFELFVGFVKHGLLDKGFERALQIGDELERQGRRADAPFYYHMAYIQTRLRLWDEASRYVQKSLSMEDSITGRELQKEIETLRNR
jgi:hypothetical protein